MKKSNDIPNSIGKFFWFTLKPFQGWFWLAVVLVILSSSISQGSSYIFKLVVDAIEAGDSEKALLVGMSYPIIIFVVQMLYRASGVTVAVIQSRLIKRTNDLLAEKIIGHSKTYFADRFAGSLVSKVGNVVRGAEQMVAYIVWTYIEISVTLLVTGYFIFTTNHISGIIFVLLVILIFATNIPMIRGKRSISVATAEANSELSGKFADLFSNIDATRQYTQTGHEISRIKIATDKVQKLEFKNWLYTERMMIYNGIILFIAFLGIMYFLLQSWQVGNISSGEMVFVLALMSQITGMMIFMGQSFQGAAKAIGEMDEGIKEIIIPHEITDILNAKNLKVKKGEIILNDVTFSYEEEAVFKNLNLQIEPGQRVGLVGPSGAGKSTLVSLLLRQHDINSGAIKIDGQNIAKVTQDSLRQNIAVVPQEPLLFHRTIAENIKYGKPKATKTEMMAVAKKAQAHDFIEQLSEGYSTLVGERGVKLSSGQKQRVAIARAMLKEAPVLVLDEATSALDSESEVLIQKALEKLMEGKTVLAVAHRLSTLRMMDRILVIAEGKIVQDGTHDELAKQPGLYQKLWNHQAGGFLQE